MSEKIYCNKCKGELVADYSVPQKELRCTKCGKMFEMFDDYLSEEDL